MRSVFLPACAAALALCGCGWNFGLRDERPSGIDNEVRAAERGAMESRTLSHLAAIENAVADYVKSEGDIPARLDVLIPKYLAEIPAAAPGLRPHKETNEVQLYPADVIRDGAVDGSRLQDTGKWGYVHNDRQVIVFVDCTHSSSRGKPWYRERGVF